MSLILYINGQQVDLEPKQVIAQTKQVNDLNSLDNRQASYTNKFKIPKTARNLRIMQFLTLTGNNSGIPYQKNECSLYSGSGECFVYKGHAVITDGGDNFDVVVYDGIIDLYKAVENRTLAELDDISDLNHDKTIENIITSWNPANNLPYRYILADYNGKPGTGIMSFPYVNIDYQVPAVNVAWLWEKIFTTHNFRYFGSVFNTEKFKNLWMTFPKGIGSTGEGTVILNTTVLGIRNSSSQNDFSTDSYWRTVLMRIVPSTIDFQYMHYDPFFYKMIVKESGYYKISLSGSINSQDNVKVFICKNVDSFANSVLATLSPYMTLEYNLEPEEPFEAETPGIYLVANESVSVLLRHPSFPEHAVRFNGDEIWSLELTMEKVNISGISFTEALSEFPVRDFLSEIVHRFGLTLFKDKYTGHYEFLTLQEQLQTPGIIDWSDRFCKKVSENYIYGSYAQQNWLRYNYNDKETSYNDGHIDIHNINLAASKDIIKSKIYSPERYKSVFLSRPSNVYKLWEKEVVEDPAEGEEPVTYKPLDKRFYFIRAVEKTQDIILYSEEITSNAQVNSFWTDSFWKLSFVDIVQDYYLPYQQILDRSLVVNAEFWLTDADIVNFDFRKLYYIKQLSSYFLMNKITNYIPGKPVRCELVKIAYAEAQELPPPIKITKVVPAGNGGMGINIYYDLNLNADAVTLQVLGGYQSSGWASFPYNATSPRYFDFTPTGNMTIRLLAGSVYSNEVPLTIPLTQTIEIP